MLKPKRLDTNDKIAIVSLSWGGLGDKNLIHKYYIAKERLENDFGLEVIPMPNALKGTEFVYEHPELRAKDLMSAFQDKTIKAIFCAIGGEDTIRILPYIDFKIIRENPKIFMGYSDTTVNHFMMNKAGLISFYGPSVMCEFGEYVKMFDYTKEAENKNIEKTLIKEEHGYEVLQGTGKITGQILGGCIDVFPMIIGTTIWPKQEEWKDKILLIETSEDKKILLIETSEDKLPPNYLTYYLRNLGAEGILDEIKGIIIGKPQEEKYYEEYKEVYKKVLKEYHKEDLPVLYNINIGHAYPTGIIPLGIEVEVDFDNKTIRLLESATEE